MARPPLFLGQFQHLSRFHHNFIRVSRRPAARSASSICRRALRRSPNRRDTMKILQDHHHPRRSASRRHRPWTAVRRTRRCHYRLERQGRGHRRQEAHAAAAECARHGDHAYRHVRGRECHRAAIYALPAQAHRRTQCVKGSGGGRCRACRAGRAASGPAEGARCQSPGVAGADRRGDAKTSGIALGKQGRRRDPGVARQ